MHSRYLAPLAAALLVAAPVIAPAAFAQDKTVTLKMSTWVPPQHPINPALIAWARGGGGACETDAPTPIMTTPRQMSSTPPQV